eukprot:754801-Hanusia_phi.AAC.1
MLIFPPGWLIGTCAQLAIGWFGLTTIRSNHPRELSNDIFTVPCLPSNTTRLLTSLCFCVFLCLTKILQAGHVPKFFVVYLRSSCDGFRWACSGPSSPGSSALFSTPSFPGCLVRVAGPGPGAYYGPNHTDVAVGLRTDDRHPSQVKSCKTPPAIREDPLYVDASDNLALRVSKDDS